jgi:hypothetical protein
MFLVSLKTKSLGSKVNSRLQTINYISARKKFNLNQNKNKLSYDCSKAIELEEDSHELEFVCSKEGKTLM